METRSKKMNTLLLAKKKMPVKPHNLPQMQEPVYCLGNLRTGLHMFHNLAAVTISDSQPLASPGFL